MALNGIDVASYQAGLDPAKVPCDFVIVKATQGTTYINPDFTRMADAVLRAGKLLGIYHYASGGNQIKEVPRIPAQPENPLPDAMLHSHRSFFTNLGGFHPAAALRAAPDPVRARRA